jgi:hypothetical protein
MDVSIFSADTIVSTPPEGTKKKHKVQVSASGEKATECFPDPTELVSLGEMLQMLYTQLFLFPTACTRSRGWR